MGTQVLESGLCLQMKDTDIETKLSTTTRCSLTYVFLVNL